MKIYEPKGPSIVENQYDFIDLLVDNDLPLIEKITNLNSAYEKIKLTPLGVEKLILILCEKLKLIIKYPRRGDNNNRYDALLEIVDRPEKLGIVEIEVPSTAMLDAPRNLLDNIAVVCSRYNRQIEEIIPLVFCWAFPNNRTDYWNVIYDINKVLGIKIKTISIMSLAILYWTGNKIDLESMFYLDSENNIANEMIDIICEQNIPLSDVEGFFAPIK